MFTSAGIVKPIGTAQQSGQIFILLPFFFFLFFKQPKTSGNG
uniref:Uncharacterized protein n=1 Tax=Anguilla anguilla TaxID=7936 RepID=A0A0E9Q0G4_ANGAN